MLKSWSRHRFQRVSLWWIISNSYSVVGQHVVQSVFEWLHSKVKEGRTIEKEVIGYCLDTGITTSIFSLSWKTFIVLCSVIDMKSNTNSYREKLKAWLLSHFGIAGQSLHEMAVNVSSLVFGKLHSFLISVVRKIRRVGGGKQFWRSNWHLKACNLELPSFIWMPLGFIANFFYLFIFFYVHRLIPSDTLDLVHLLY